MTKKNFNSSILIILSVFFSVNCFSFSIVKISSNENLIEAVSPDYLKASVFVKMSASEFATVTGKKLNLFERMYFNAVKKRVKHDLKKNPDLLITDYFDETAHKFKFDPLWFVIAAFIGPLGVLLAYISKPRKGGPVKKDIITSAWLGFALFVIWFGFIFIF